jgi:hypothetical protein
VTLNGQPLTAGDGVAITQAGLLQLLGTGDTANEILLFDMEH